MIIIPLSGPAETGYACEQEEFVRKFDLSRILAHLKQGRLWISCERVKYFVCGPRQNRTAIYALQMRCSTIKL